jgi:dCTP deaminase
MILTGLAICRERLRGKISIEPFDKQHVNPNSYNFHLHNRILMRGNETDRWHSQTLGTRGIVLFPRKLYLAATAEVIGSENYVVTLLGKSSIGRLGIFLNITADLGHLGCRSRWTLELMVVQPVRVYAGMCIGQVAFWTATKLRSAQYNGRYHRNLSPVPNRDLNLLTRNI